MPEPRGSRRTPLVVTHFDIPAGFAAEVAVADMMLPGQCLTCSHVFDVAGVTVIQRYADCSVWRCPSCGSTHDDRPGHTVGSRMGYRDLRRRRRSTP